LKLQSKIKKQHFGPTTAAKKQKESRVCTQHAVISLSFLPAHRLMSDFTSELFDCLNDPGKSVYKTKQKKNKQTTFPPSCFVG